MLNSEAALRYHSSCKKNKASDKRKHNNRGAYEEIDRSGIIRTSIEKALDRSMHLIQKLEIEKGWRLTKKEIRTHREDEWLGSWFSVGLGIWVVGLGLVGSGSFGSYILGFIQ